MMTSWEQIDDIDHAQRIAEGELLLGLFRDVRDEPDAERKRLMAGSLYAISLELMTVTAREFAKARSALQRELDQHAVKH